MTEVTEVTSEQPAAAAAEGEVKKEEEPKEKPKEEKKKETKPKVEKPPPDYKTVKAGWIEKPGKEKPLSLSLSLSLFLSPSLSYLILIYSDCVYRCYLQELQTSLHDPG